MRLNFVTILRYLLGLVFIVVLFLVGCGGREIEVYEGVLDGKEACA
jgi:hypothetical protein